MVTIGNKGTCFIDHVPKLELSRPVRVSPVDSMSLDSDSVALMNLSLNRWGFPCSDGDLQIYHTSRRVKRHGSQKQGSPPVVGDVRLPSELP